MHVVLEVGKEAILSPFFIRLFCSCNLPDAGFLELILSIQRKDMIIPVPDINGVIAVNIGTITEPAKFTRTPRKDITISMKCKAMVAAYCYLDDIA